MSALKKATLILITDDPAHHLDVKAIAFLRRPGAPVVMTQKALAGFQRACPRQRPTHHGGRRARGIHCRLRPDARRTGTPRGEASGYLITLGGRRILFAGVTECVPELLALKDIDVAFVPMNIPPGRMTPAAAADW